MLGQSVFPTSMPWEMILSMQSNWSFMGHSCLDRSGHYGKLTLTSKAFLGVRWLRLTAGRLQSCWTWWVSHGTSFKLSVTPCHQPVQWARHSTSPDSNHLETCSPKPSHSHETKLQGCVCFFLNQGSGMAGLLKIRNKFQRRFIDWEIRLILYI